jgi:hypothetical protein
VGFEAPEERVRWLHRGLILLGGIGFIALVARSGLAALWRDAASLGIGTALIVAAAFLEHVLHAAAWARCFDPRHRPALRHLLGAYLAGWAVNLVTPTATMGGEVVRGSLLPRGVPPGDLVSALTADRLAMALGDTAIGLAGFLVLVTRAPVTGWGRLGLAASALLFVAGVAAFFQLQRSGRLASFLGEGRAAARLLGPERAGRLAAAGREVDGRLAELHASRPGDFRVAVLIHMLGTSVGAVQLGLFLWWLGEPFDLQALLVVFSVATALDLFTFFVPARLGTQEASRMLAMSVAGLDPARGLLYSLVLRLEQIVWGGVGLVLAPALEASRRGRKAPLAPSPAEGDDAGLQAVEPVGTGAAEALDAAEGKEPC